MITELVTLLRVAVVATLLPAQAPQPPQPRADFVVQVENTLAMARPDEVIAIPWSTVAARITGAAASKVRARDMGSGREVPTQVLDADGNGTPDSLLILADFRGRELRQFRVEGVAPAAWPARTAVRHDEPRDDMAWESDKLAWRIYGQGLKKTSSAMSSSGVDIWVKKTRDLIVAKWYDKGHDEYHVDKGEGADFYDVGETLGAGGTALWVNDSLVRADNFTTYKVIASGPIRTIFSVEYPEWGTSTLKVSQTKRISIDAGSNLFKEESVFHAPSGTKPFAYAIGELKRTGMTGTMSKANAWAWLTGWGPTTPKNGGDGDVGTAFLLPRSSLRDWKEVGDHYLAISTATPGIPVVHYVGAGWTLSGDFRDVKDWWRYLDEYAQRLAAPVKVTVVAP